MDWNRNVTLAVFVDNVQVAIVRTDPRQLVGFQVVLALFFDAFEVVVQLVEEVDVWGEEELGFDLLVMKDGCSHLRCINHQHVWRYFDL